MGDIGKSQRRLLIQRHLLMRERFSGVSKRASCVKKANKPSGEQQLERSSKAYRGSCGGCFERKKWCGFDHDGIDGRNRARIREKKLAKASQDEFKRALCGRVENRVRFCKVMVRLERAFKSRPVKRETDPRNVLDWLAYPSLDVHGLQLAFEHLGVGLEDWELQSILEIDKRRHSLRVKDFVALCAAAGAFRDFTHLLNIFSQ